MTITFKGWEEISRQGLIITDTHPGWGGTLKLSGKEALQVRDELLRRYPLTVNEMDALLEKQGLTLGALMRQERHRFHAKQQPTPAPLSLEVGKWYLRRDGGVVQIVAFLGASANWPYTSSEGGTYRGDGCYYGPRDSSPADLIEEVQVPALKLEVGKWYLRRDGRKVKVLSAHGTEKYQCFSAQGDFYQIDGRYLHGPANGPDDLIAETTAPDEQDATSAAADENIRLLEKIERLQAALTAAIG